MNRCSRQMGEGRALGRSTRAGYCREGEIVMLPIRRTKVSRMGVTGIGWGRGYYTGDSWQGEDLTMRGRMTRPGVGWGTVAAAPSMGHTRRFRGEQSTGRERKGCWLIALYKEGME